MVLKKTLFDDDQLMEQPKDIKKEVMPLDKLKNLDEKITAAIERVKTLKEDKAVTDKKIKELERLLDEKSQEVEQFRTEKNIIKSQLEALLTEIESLEGE
jgi:chromosome segregation ATPase